ncbi:MAG: phosphoribosyl-AMP cyclohydrolase [Pseudomonadales bacterium]|nr:phosphoribosyl-AMP cyclohydrolase [Pseudomonadales bacterium]
MTGSGTFADLEGARLGAGAPLGEILEALRYDAQGLIPAIAQDADSGVVLMLAWMNRAAIERTLAEGYACYWSRSRAAFWRKGETSGHLQALVELRFDCDGDAVLLRVRQSGPACHTNRPSCFYLLARDGSVRITADPV